MYYYICGTDSELTWGRAWEYAYKFLDGLDSRVTVASDREKGLRKAMVSMFGPDSLKGLSCSYHRSVRLRQRFGKTVVSVYYELMNCKTVSEIASANLEGSLRV